MRLPPGSHLLILFLLTVGSSLSAEFEYTINAGEVTITRYSGAGGNVAVPTQIESLPVTRIGPQAFQGKTAVTGVALPGSVKVIQSEAFRECSALRFVTFQEGLVQI